METKQSAVEWLISQVMYEYEIYTDEEGDFMDKPKIAYYGSHQECTDLSKFVKKALEMEKEQIAEAFNNSYWFIDGIEYYEKTYGK